MITPGPLFLPGCDVMIGYVYDTGLGSVIVSSEEVQGAAGYLVPGPRLASEVRQVLAAMNEAHFDVDQDPVHRLLARMSRRGEPRIHGALLVVGQHRRGTVVARLDVSRAGRRDEDDDLPGGGDQGLDPLAELLTG